MIAILFFFLLDFGFLDDNIGFENILERSLFLIVFELLFYCHSSALVLEALLSEVCLHVYSHKPMSCKLSLFQKFLAK